MNTGNEAVDRRNEMEMGHDKYLMLGAKWSGWYVTLTEGPGVQGRAPEPAGELGVRLFSKATRCFASLVRLAVAFALARQFVLRVLLPPLGFVPTPPSIAVCLPLALRVHRCFPQPCLRPPSLQSLSFYPVF